MEQGAKPRGTHSMEVRTMLVLSRKVGEKIMIGDNITLIVRSIEGHRIKLGIDAPKVVKVVRGENGIEKPNQRLPSSNMKGSIYDAEPD